jgi:hypothetical protein
MNKNLNEIFKNNPEATKAADGWLIKTEHGIFHVFDIYSEEETKGLLPDETLYLPFCSHHEIHSMREPANASTYLLKLRADAIAENPRFLRIFRKRIKGVPNWSLTKWYNRTDQALDSYKNKLSKGAQNKINNIPTGMALLNEVNAMCIASRHGNYIVVSEALEYFLYYMNLAFYGQHLGASQDDEVAALVIAVRTMLGSESLDFDLDPRGDIPEKMNGILREFTDYQISFAFGHEYAHHILGHVQPANLSTKNLPELLRSQKNTACKGLYNYNHSKEYDADIYAIKNLKLDTEYKSKITTGAFRMFIYFDLLGHVFSVMAKNLSPSSTHPAPLDRLHKLRRRLHNKFGLDEDAIDIILKKSSQYKYLLEKNFIPFHYDELMQYGSNYLPSYKKMRSIDRIDF